MTIPVLAALSMAGAMGVFIVSWCLIRRIYKLPTPAHERQTAATSDGWELALYRYLPPGGARPGREPVILCHGMLSNRFNVDLDARTSLARYLSSRGFDAWVMELRGHGGSRRAKGAGQRPFDWDLDDYIRRDIPAVIDAVRDRAGAERVHWFGHSMGGMLLYAYCSLDGSTRAFKSAVLTDAPASFTPMRGRGGVPLGRLYGRLIPAVPPALVLPFLGPTVWIFPRVMSRRYGLADRRTLMPLLANAIIPWGSSRVLLQLCDILESGRFLASDGSIDYENGAGRVDFPLLVLSSARKLMDERMVRDGYERCTSTHKKYIRFSRENGYAIDYTHSNFLLAHSSPEEVFPAIAEWFEAHSG